MSKAFFSRDRWLGLLAPGALNWIVQSLLTRSSLNTKAHPFWWYILSSWVKHSLTHLTLLHYYNAWPMGSFNNYVDQMLPNFDQLLPSSEHFGIFYLLPTYPLFTWPSMHGLTTYLPLLVHVAIVDCTQPYKVGDKIPSNRKLALAER